MEKTDSIYRDTLRGLFLCSLGKTALRQNDRAGAQAAFTQAVCHLRVVRPDSEREGLLARMGVEVVHRDLKAPARLAMACQQVEAVISTATSINSRGPRDSLKRVDRDGQLAMETSFSSAVGWDIPARKAHVFGPGTQPISYISREDVPSLASFALTHPSVEQRFLPLGGPEALSPLQAVQIFEKAAGQALTIRRTPVWVLQGLRTLMRPFNPRLSSLMALGVAAARGAVIDMSQIQAEFGAPLPWTSVREFARARLQAVTQRQSHFGESRPESSHQDQRPVG